jgi:hypothetical protein
MMLARLVAAVCAASENQKSPIDLSEFERPVPEPDDAYVNECCVLAANGALQASTIRAGNDAPEPCRSTAWAGVEATNPKTSAIAADFASIETFINFPLLDLGVEQGQR